MWRDHRNLTTEEDRMPEHKVGTQEEFDAAREQLLAEEKELTRRDDELTQKRLDLPWVPVEKEYELETAEGKKSLAELFDGRSQLLIYHFMFGPSYEAGCPTCSSMADGIDGVLPHLQARDLTMLLVSRAPLEKLMAYRERMGWSIPWASSANSDFNFDFGASFHEEEMRAAMPPEDQLPPIASRNAKETGTDLVSYISEMFGSTAFTRQDGTVYKTYATTGRGVEFLMGYYPILDRTPRGRQEDDGFQLWIRRHDEY
jgi:predicted dithiol-disulfide oxidoreductase (DUF899 family)